MLSDTLLLIICTWFQDDDESLAQSSSSSQHEYPKGKSKKRAKTVSNRSNRQERPACIEKASLNHYDFVFSLFIRSCVFLSSLLLSYLKNKTFIFGRSRRLWNFLVPSTWQPDPELGLDEPVCFLLFIIVFWFLSISYIHPTILLLCFCDYNPLLLLFHKTQTFV